jgi:hypothetical protein
LPVGQELMLIVPLPHAAVTPAEYCVQDDWSELMQATPPLPPLPPLEDDAVHPPTLANAATATATSVVETRDVNVQSGREDIAKTPSQHERPQNASAWVSAPALESL